MEIFDPGSLSEGLPDNMAYILSNIYISNIYITKTINSQAESLVKNQLI